MLLVRSISHGKPGKVRPMVENMLAMSKLGEKNGIPKMRVMTDFCSEQFWTIVAKMEVPSMAAFEQMMQGPPPGQSTDDAKKMEKIMKDYHMA